MRDNYDQVVYQDKDDKSADKLSGEIEQMEIEYSIG